MSMHSLPSGLVNSAPEVVSDDRLLANPALPFDQFQTLMLLGIEGVGPDDVDDLAGSLGVAVDAVLAEPEFAVLASIVGPRQLKTWVSAHAPVAMADRPVFGSKSVFNVYITEHIIRPSFRMIQSMVIAIQGAVLVRLHGTRAISQADPNHLLTFPCAKAPTITGGIIAAYSDGTIHEILTGARQLTSGHILNVVSQHM